MKTSILIILSLFFALNEARAEDEIRWLKLRQELGLEYIINAVFAPGDSTILVTDANLKVVEINANTGKLVRNVPIWGAYQFSDDKQFLYCNADGKVKWPSCEMALKYNKFGIPKYPSESWNSHAIVNENNNLLFVIGSNSFYPGEWKKDNYVFDLNTFQFVDTLGIIPQVTERIEMTGDGKYFRTITRYKDWENLPDWETEPKDITTINWWDTKTLKLLSKEHSLMKIIDDLGIFRVSPDNKWLCSVGGRSVKVFDNQTYELKYQWEVDGSLESIDISSDSRYLFTAGGSMQVDADLYIWDLKVGSLAYKYNNKKAGIGIPFLKVSNNGKYIIDYGEGGLCMFNNMLSPNTNVPESAEPVIYPNPSDGVVILNSKYFQVGQLNIELYDMHGRLLGVLYDGFYKQEELKLDISYVNDGIFLIRTMQGKEFKTFKLIKGR